MLAGVGLDFILARVLRGEWNFPLSSYVTGLGLVAAGQLSARLLCAPSPKRANRGEQREQPRQPVTAGEPIESLSRGESKLLRGCQYFLFVIALIS